MVVENISWFAPVIKPFLGDILVDLASFICCIYNIRLRSDGHDWRRDRDFGPSVAVVKWGDQPNK
jgi:hypothetical protein